MRFTLTAPTISFPSKRKHTIDIGDDIETDETTIKVPVFENGPAEAVLQWRKHFEESDEVKEFTPRQKFTNVAILLSGKAKEHWIDSQDSEHLILLPISLQLNISKKQ
jgi:hypothetical protein